MSPFEDLGRMLLLIGGLIFALGLLLLLAGKIPFLGRLPGDITIRRDDFTCMFPLMTSLVLSLLLTLLLNLLLRLHR
ncbi:MAG: DUF2905 domain-containing protein [Chloroflexi bacterium]|nr:DUF2905 domain-containing protein [Chloroflexota bacterium]